MFVIMDACCSGTGVRGSGAEVSRKVPAEQLVPKAALDVADRLAKQSPAKRDRAQPTLFEVGMQGVIAIYAAQPHETTPERKMSKGDDARYFGLLSYTICEILQSARSKMTYRELVLTVNARYVASGRRSPTPLIEGPARDRVVLGREEFPERSRLILSRSEGRWTVNAGQLRGLTEGSILAVFPPAGSKSSDETVGHARIAETSVASCTVVPTEFDGSAAVGEFPDGGDVNSSTSTTGINDYSWRSMSTT